MISIIIPVYNVEKYIHECIDSIYKQDYQNYEIILIDDGSLDVSPQICDEYAKKDNRVKVIHKKNGGLSSSRNVGIENAKGDFLMFLDSDDIIRKDMLSSLLHLQQKFDADIVVSPLLRFKNDETFFRFQNAYYQNDILYTGIEHLRDIFLERVNCSSCAKLYKRNLLENHRFPLGRYNEDFVFLSYLLARVNKVVYTPIEYYLYRITPNSLTHNFGVKNLDVLSNATEIKQFVINNDLPLLHEINIFEIIKKINFAFGLIRNKRVSDFENIYNECKKSISENMSNIILSKYYNTKIKIKTLLIVFTPISFFKYI